MSILPPMDTGSLLDLSLPPDSPSNTPLRPTRLAKWGAWLQLAPLIGGFFTSFAMVRVFSHISATGELRDKEAGDPAKLSEGIGWALMGTHIGLVVSLVGCILLCLAIFKQGSQPLWVKILFGISTIPALAALQMLVFLLARATA
ncbi:MotA/TolQ/ExbB proton channel family protein [Brevifollis gellanilyticus]|nr:MotA/TolQ/ExbB proton channel family protein [Brevifollis gellanilyticus]